jgi:hypothetical protein
MWRAFWVAMREPVKRYAPDQRITIAVDVDSDQALVKLAILAKKAEQLRRMSS